MARIEFNESAFRELRTSAGAKMVLHDHAGRIAHDANAVASTTNPAKIGPYYEIEDGTDDDRARLRVKTTGPRAAAHEAKTQALQRGI